jgi:uncharacterized protein
MDWSILIVAPAGAGKRQLIRTISTITLLGDEETPTAGALRLREGGRVRLYSAPSRQHQRFTWDALLHQAQGVVVLIDHSRPDAAADLEEHLRELRRRPGAKAKPILVGVTHADKSPGRSLQAYHDVWRAQHNASPLVLAVDAREREEVRTLLLAMTAMLEIAAGLSSCHGA